MVAEFDNGNEPDGAVVGPPNGWHQLAVNLWRKQIVFERKVNEDGAVTVTCDCDDPSMMMLARKNDAAYWSNNVWSKHLKDRRLWSADIACRMLTEGLVATGRGVYDRGIQEAMEAASSPRNRRKHKNNVHTLTNAVAQIRGLRFVQSMMPAKHCYGTTLGGYNVPFNAAGLLNGWFNYVRGVYSRLPRPPWDDGVAWGPQETAGHATDVYTGEDVFVGEHSDLMWRALTETDRHWLVAVESHKNQRPGRVVAW